MCCCGPVNTGVYSITGTPCKFISNIKQDLNTPVFTRIQPHYSYSLMDYFLKYFLFLCNLVFTVLGLVVLGLGMWGLITKESFAQEKISSIGTDPMLILVTLGLLLTMLCLSGCVGAVRENCCLLKLFSAAVLMLITAQVLAAIMAYSLQDQIGGYLRSGINVFSKFAAQCFIFFPSFLRYYNCSAPGVLACGVPATCCVDPLENGTVWNSQCGVGAQQLDEFTAQSVIFLGGCLGGISRWIEQHEGLIGTVGIVAVGVQILTLFITTRLLESIQWHKVYI
uniref:Tetraspanin 10 n=1 Tax=Seriola dumerili TaxID=41447 RepID=A0A3B4UGC5_SERDU